MAVIPVFTEEARRRQDLAFHRELYSNRVYRYDAVSGAQIRIKLGRNVILEDATAVQFTLTQGKKPIYGYASQLFDAVADGVVIVHGRLWINFIHQGYLRLLMEAAKSGGSITGSNLTREGRLEDRNIPLSPKNLIEAVKTENEQLIRRTLEPAAESLGRPDKKGSIDITIDYGAPRKNEDSPAHNPTFDPPPRKTIYECHFLAEGQEINISGQPIMEWYEFIAKRVT